jgi:hypothetical protein
MTPQQNGMTKWRNHIVVEHLCLLNVDNSFSSFLWIEAISMANYLVDHNLTKPNQSVTTEDKYTCNDIVWTILEFLVASHTYIYQKNKEKNLRAKKKL